MVENLYQGILPLFCEIGHIIEDMNLLTVNLCYILKNKGPENVRWDNS